MIDSASRSVVLRIVNDFGEPLYATSLVKLVYLVDYLHFRHRGRTATGLEYKWDQFGPNAVGNEILAAAEDLQRDGILAVRPAPGGDTARAYVVVSPARPAFDPLLETIIADVLSTYGHLSVSELKSASKDTLPFRFARQGQRLRMEKSNLAPPEVTLEDWNRHLRDRESRRGMSVAEVKSKYGVD